MSDETEQPKKKRGRHPNSLANMQKAGEPGHNPKGRPVGTSINTYAKGLVLQSLDATDKSGRTAMDRFLTGFIERAVTEPNGWQAKNLADKLLPTNAEQLDEIFNRAKTRDTDFLAYRIIKTCHDYQQRVILSKEKFIYLMAGRRAGKTEGMIRKALTVAVEHEAGRILIIGLTLQRCLDYFWGPTIQILKDLGIPYELRTAENLIVLQNESQIFFSGNTSKADREKWRGSKWHIVMIDEAQSQSELERFVSEVIEPSLIDYNGQLILAGTGPRSRGTYWERVWTEEKHFPGMRLNWNLMNNPFIKDGKAQLQDTLVRKNLTESSPLYIREYLGGIAYDDDALVFRLSDNNVFVDQQMVEWINSQPRSDIKFSGGIDYGYVDYTAVVGFMYSETKPEKWLIFERKWNGRGIDEIKSACHDLQMYIGGDQKFKDIPERNKFCPFYCDTNEQTITYELYKSGIPAQNAMKYDKDWAIEALRDEVRTGTLKVRKTLVPNPNGGEMPDPLSFYNETLLTLYERNERDELTHQIDDRVYHPDLMDAVLYALRNVWAFSQKVQS